MLGFSTCMVLSTCLTFQYGCSTANNMKSLADISAVLQDDAMMKAWFYSKAEAKQVGQCLASTYGVYVDSVMQAITRK